MVARSPIKSLLEQERSISGAQARKLMEDLNALEDTRRRRQTSQTLSGRGARGARDVKGVLDLGDTALEDKDLFYMDADERKKVRVLKASACTIAMKELWCVHGVFEECDLDCNGAIDVREIVEHIDNVRARVASSASSSVALAGAAIDSAVRPSASTAFCMRDLGVRGSANAVRAAVRRVAGGDAADMALKDVIKLAYPLLTDAEACKAAVFLSSFGDADARRLAAHMRSEKAKLTRAFAQHLFKSLDRNGDGVLQPGEFADIVNAEDDEFQDDAAALFREADADRNQVIDHVEFENWWVHTNELSPK